MKAVYLRANLHYESHDVARAVPLYQQILDYGEERRSPEWTARAAYALGNCAIEQRDWESAFEQRAMVTDAALAGLDIADGLLATGDMRQIVPLPQHLFSVFRNAEMLTGALTAIADL